MNTIRTRIVTFIAVVVCSILIWKFFDDNRSTRCASAKHLARSIAAMGFDSMGNPDPHYLVAYLQDVLDSCSERIGNRRKLRTLKIELILNEGHLQTDVTYIVHLNNEQYCVKANRHVVECDNKETMGRRLLLFGSDNSR